MIELRTPQEKKALLPLFPAGENPLLLSALLGADGAAYLPAGEDGTTRLPGLFVAGDCRVKGLRQLATAIGDGACAGMAAARYAEGQK